MSTDELLLIDLSSLFRPFFAMAPDTAVTQTVDRVRALAQDHPHAAICCDSGRSFRRDIDANYKAQRPATDETLVFQEGLAKEKLRADGFPVWAKPGFEADDLIATATKQALAMEGTVLIVSADKDLLQLVGPNVQVLHPKNSQRVDVEWVKENYRIEPAQILDYLSLVGDASDNIIGAKGIGPKRAVQLLQTFGSIAQIYEALDKGEAAAPQGILDSLIEFRSRWPNVRELVTLRTDVEIPFEEIAAERVAVGDVATIAPLADLDDEPQPTKPQPIPLTPAQSAGFIPTAPVKLPTHNPPPSTEWGKQLEPRSMGEAARLADAMYQARLFSGYGSAQAVLSTILAVRELGFNAIASLRAFHVIDNKHSLAADAMRALVLRSGSAQYFRCTERTAERCTWETHRNGDPTPVSLTYTIQQGRAMWQKDERAWSQSGWARNPEDMLSARASSKLARLVYSDILFGLYAPEELRDEVA